MIRPVLEYASPAWNPFYRKDIDELEKLQKRALKLSITPVESVPLEQRRLEVYKYLSGLNRNNPEDCFYQRSSNLSRQKNSPHSSSLGRKSRAAFANSAIWQFRSHLATELIT